MHARFAAAVFLAQPLGYEAATAEPMEQYQ